MIVDAESMIEWFVLDIEKTAELQGHSPKELDESTIYIMAEEKTESLIKYLGGDYEKQNTDNFLATH